MPERTFWGIHAKGQKLAELLLTHHQLAIGWEELGDLTSIAGNREAIKAALKVASPNEKPGAIPVIAGELYRFATELAIGDIVVFRSNEGAVLNLGEVVGPYVYDSTHDPAHPNRRAVKWLKSIPSTAASLGALHELGSALAFFQVRNYVEEWTQLLANGAPNVPEDSDEIVAFVAEASEQNTRDFVLKRLATQLKGHPLAALVGNLLETMGYRAKVSPPGPDGGVDIVANRGELGFEPPIVRVQVKSSQSSIGGPEVAQLLGNLAPGEFGLFVTLGYFTPQAKSKLKPHLRLVDGEQLVDLLLEHYDQLDPRYRSLIPLKRVYVPQPLADE